MKKSKLLSWLSLGVAGVLGVGAFTVIKASPKKAVKAKAATEVLWKTFNFSDTFLSSIEEANAVDGFWITWSIEGNGNTAAMQDGALHMHVVEPGGRNVFDLRYRIPTNVEICKIEIDAIPGLDGNGVGGRNQNFSIQANLDGAYADRQYIQRSGSSSATTKSTFTFTPKEADGPNILNQISLKLGTETKNRNTQYTFDTYFWEMRFYKAVYSQPVTITAGTGVQSVYLSENSTATSGSASGTNYDIGKTVYGFATIQTGYSAPSGWAKVSGNTYRVGSKTVGESGANFGTVNATLDTYSIQYTLNGGSVSGNPTSYNVNSNAFTLKNPTKTGYTFDGWSGTGISGKSTSVTINKGSTGDRSYTANWSANTYTVKYNGNKPANAPGSVSNIPTNATWTYDSNASLGNAPSLTGYVFDGWYKENTCTTKVGNAGQQLTKPNLTATKGATVNLYAKWTFDPAIQAVIDEINKTKTVSYDNLTSQIEIADAAYNGLSETYQEIVDAEGYTQILDNAKAADMVGQMIEDLGDAEDTPEWRSEVSSVRTAYEALADKSFIPDSTILKILEDDEAAVVVMDDINAIGETRWTNEFKVLIDTAQNAYDEYELEGRPTSQIANYQTLVNAHTDYNNVQAFVDKVNAITNHPFEYSDACKALIDEARRYFEEDLSGYQKGLATSDASTYYELLVNYENAYNAMYLIDQINDMENTEACGKKIEDARAAIDGLDPTTELPLINAGLLKELTDKEAGWAVIELINTIYPMVYGEDCEDAIEAARSAYDSLEDDQKQYAVNYDLLTKAESDYASVEAVVEQVKVLGDIRHDEESLAKIESARSAYEGLSADQKDFYPEGSLQTIVDYETAYDTLDKIYEIGAVEYNSESQDKINEARELYDSLSEEQKELIHNDDLQVLIAAESEYASLKKTANILVIILLILICLTILGGIWFLFFLLKKKRKDDDDNDENNQNNKKGKPVKAMSVGGFIPGVILVSHYLDAPYIALYVLAGVAVLLWISILVIAIMKKKQVGPFKKKAADAAKTGEVESSTSGDEEVKTITDEKGNVFQIRFVKSFTAKLIQANEESKKYYEILKNEVLSYKNTNSRVSWHYDAINSGRNYVLKFAIRGKTLCVYFPLNADEFAESKYKVEKTELKKFEDVPCLYRIKNDRRCEYAKELIALVAKNLGLEKGEEQHESYADVPYEPNKPLLERGLIKEQKVQISKPVEQEVVEVVEDEEGDEIITTKDSAGHISQIRHLRSFSAKLSQASDEVKNYYNVIKNHVLSYKDVTSRVSWHYDAINVGKEKAIKFVIKRKTLCVYYALSEVDEKFKVEMVEFKKYADTPCLYRIKNDRRCSYAKQLVNILMKKLHVKKGEESNQDFSLPYEDSKALIAKGLIKEVKITLPSK